MSLISQNFIMNIFHLSQKFLKICFITLLFKVIPKHRRNIRLVSFFKFISNLAFLNISKILKTISRVTVPFCKFFLWVEHNSPKNYKYLHLA